MCPEPCCRCRSWCQIRSFVTASPPCRPSANCSRVEPNYRSAMNPIKHVNELELYRVKDVVVDQAGLQRLLGYGTITVLAADDTTPEVDLVGLKSYQSQRDDQNPVPCRSPAR